MSPEALRLSTMVRIADETQMRAATRNVRRRWAGGPLVAVAPKGSASSANRAQARPSRRLVELDGLRGLAALSVVCFHWLLTDPAFAIDPGSGPLTSGMNWLNETPLRALVAGPEMVLLFFVLSGMVLALPRLAGRGATYGRYLLSRALRLYPAVWAVTAIAALALLVEPGDTHGRLAPSGSPGSSAPRSGRPTRSTTSG